MPAGGYAQCHRSQERPGKTRGLTRGRSQYIFSSSCLGFGGTHGAGTRAGKLAQRTRQIGFRSFGSLFLDVLRGAVVSRSSNPPQKSPSLLVQQYNSLSQRPRGYAIAYPHSSLCNTLCPPLLICISTPTAQFSIFSVQVALSSVLTIQAQLQVVLGRCGQLLVEPHRSTVDLARNTLPKSKDSHHFTLGRGREYEIAAGGRVGLSLFLFITK